MLCYVVPVASIVSILQQYGRARGKSAWILGLGYSSWQSIMYTMAHTQLCRSSHKAPPHNPSSHMISAVLDGPSKHFGHNEDERERRMRSISIPITIPYSPRYIFMCHPSTIRWPPRFLPTCEIWKPLALASVSSLPTVFVKW